MLIALGFRPTKDSLSLYSSFLEKKIACYLFYFIGIKLIYKVILAVGFSCTTK